MPHADPISLATGCFFLTVALLQRPEPSLLMHIDTLREALVRARDVGVYHVEAIAVLPDHLHGLFSLPPDAEAAEARWQRIKAAILQGLPGDADPRRPSAICQYQLREHAIRDPSDFQRLIDYIHFNPVKHALAARAADWPHSTFKLHLARGAYSADWQACAQVRAMNLE
ncbi:putative transposase [Solimonas aquatica]|uniref:Putative transposase n=1 Tax=Solimonas aquatica TaxID=489703 RepID=A0A1H9G126_9GAMM|nr:hypothetical protein [Solimonas aquatica]SEQ43807.1 putative transposase [Solimonas aquatica]